jgi:hypothetical protein
MRTFTRGLVAAACTVAVLGLAAGAAQAQFLIDHYKVYPILDPGSSGLPVDLIDQFGPSNHVIGAHEKLANPVLKAIAPDIPGIFPGPLLQPFEHLSWWRIPREVLPPRFITVTNQFGSVQWELGNAKYLLVPAEKNLQPGIVLNQHYKCYDAIGHNAFQTVNLIDQFFDTIPDTHDVLAPRYFCNPVEKLGPPPLVPSGIPPVPNDHLACYDITPGGLPPAVTIDDQVSGPDPHSLGSAEMLCVPSLKEVRADIPVLSPWGLVAFGVLLTGAMYATIRRRGASLKA